MMSADQMPFVEVVEQPAHNLHRFRYSCENHMGCIVGVNSSPKMKTYPSIRVQGYQGPAVIIISCVTKDAIPKAHPHNIVGTESCENGICTMKVNLNGDVVSLFNLGIQCVKKKEVRAALRIRKANVIDPFNTGFEHSKYPDTIDLNAVRLAFQVFIPGPDRKFNVPLRAIATVPIYDKKSFPELVLNSISHNKAPVSGGLEVILLCEKVSRNDIQVRFFEIRNNLIFWDGYGEFKTEDVYKQVAISFKTPPYCNQDISEPVNIHVQLRRKSDGSTSNTLPFQMMPLNLDDVNPHSINNIDQIESLKRKRMESSGSGLVTELKMQKKNTDLVDEPIFHEPKMPQPRPIESPPPNVTMNFYAYREPTFTNDRQEHGQEEPKLNLDSRLDLDADVDKEKSQNFLDSIDSEIFENLSENLSKGLSISDQVEETHESNLELNKDLQDSQQRQQQQQKQHAVNFFQRNDRDLSAVGSYNAFSRQSFDIHDTETVTQYF